MPVLDDLQTDEQDTTYFAFRLPTKTHRQMKAILARRGISAQAFFSRIVEDLLAEERAALPHPAGWTAATREHA